MVDNLNEVERDQIMEEMKKENAEKISFVQSLEERVKSHDELYIREIMALSESEFAETILEFVNAHAPTHCTITPKILQDIRALALDPKPIMSYHLRDSYYLVKEYDVITFNKDGANLPYSYVMEAPGKLSNEVLRPPAPGLAGLPEQRRQGHLRSSLRSWFQRVPHLRPQNPRERRRKIAIIKGRWELSCLLAIAAGQQIAARNP